MANPAMINGFGSKLVSEIQVIIDDSRNGTLPPNTAYEDISDRLIQEKVVVSEVMTCDKIMCHPCNRGKMGLNGYNVHRNGSEIDRVGVDLKELNKAACFQICPLEPIRGQQIQWNQNLIAANNGLLAKLSGTETCMSVSSGHWTAWCRAIKNSCRSPMSHLTDEGVLSVLSVSARRTAECVLH